MNPCRPSLIIPHTHKQKEIKNDIYLIFSSKLKNSIELSYTNNLVGIETNIDRASQLSIDIAVDNYKNHLLESHNVIVRCERGHFKYPLYSRDNIKTQIISGCIVDKNGCRIINSTNIKLDEKS